MTNNPEICALCGKPKEEHILFIPDGYRCLNGKGFFTPQPQVSNIPLKSPRLSSADKNGVSVSSYTHSGENVPLSSKLIKDEWEGEVFQTYFKEEDVRSAIMEEEALIMLLRSDCITIDDFCYRRENYIFGTQLTDGGEDEDK